MEQIHRNSGAESTADIGIITFQAAWNCGAVLQCAALKKVLERMGHNVCVIDYVPDYQRKKYQKYPNPFTAALNEIHKQKNSSVINKGKTAAKAVVKTLLNYIPGSSHLTRKEKFDSFSRAHLNKTRTYTSLKDLQDHPPKCKVYVSGSDQVWNPSLTNGIDGAYYCDFGGQDIKRVGYAISACELDVQADHDKLKPMVSRFDHLALREVEMQSQIEGIYGKDVNICVDPTLLMGAEDYKEFEANCESEKPYILVYAFAAEKSRARLFKLIRQVQDRYHLPVKVIYGPNKWPMEVELVQPRNCPSPGEFLSSIKNAAFVVTDSFHATVFSILYQRPFYTMTVAGRGSRVAEMLEKLGLKSRLVTPETNLDELIDESIDHDLVNEKLSALRKASLAYLADAVRIEGE